MLRAVLSGDPAAISGITRITIPSRHLGDARIGSSGEHSGTVREREGRAEPVLRGWPTASTVHWESHSVLFWKSGGCRTTSPARSGPRSHRERST